MCDVDSRCVWNMVGARTEPAQARRPQRQTEQRANMSQTSAITATPATQNTGRCRHVPRLPPATQTAAATTAPNGTQPCHKSQPTISATPATQSDGRQVPRIPRKATIDVTKCHACHAKRRSMSPSATPATKVWKCVGKWCVSKWCVGK